MHDPMVVAFKVLSPIPKRDRWRGEYYKGRRWGWTRRRRTNQENLGEPVYRWWRPKGWTFALAGRVWSWRTLATVWHVEPGGRDSGEVCKHYIRWQDDDGQWHSKMKRAWKWHVHHWHLQVHPLQGLRARLFDRCELCGRKGRPNISYQWDGKRLGWWKFRSRPGLYHMECSGYKHLQQERESDETLIRHLFAAVRVQRDETEPETLAWLTDPSGRALEFAEAYRLQKVLGYQRDSGYKLVKKEGVGR